MALSVRFLHAQDAAESTLDVRRLAAAEIRVVDGERLRLITDVPPNPAVDELPTVVAAAFPLWAKYFHRPADADAGERWQACLIADRQRFAAVNLLPTDKPEFTNGYARDGQLWLDEQPSDYYRRHLLLHEGTHAWMQAQLGGCGPGWYMEGMAELLATHRWREGRLRLGVFPASRDDVPMWGRIALIREAVAAGRPWSLERVLAIDNGRVLSTTEYAWAWALCSLLDGQSRTQSRFRSLPKHVSDKQFNDVVRKTFAGDWANLAIDWDAFVDQIDYGYDVARMEMTHRQPREVKPSTAGDKHEVPISADRGWQSTGWLLRAGVAYEVTARGRYQIAVEPDGRPWPCEAGGVTLEYYQGRPLGALLGALRPVGDGGEIPRQSQRLSGSFSKPLLIGLRATIRPEADAVLYLRVNDSPAKLSDNRTGLFARISKKSPHQ